MSPLGKNIRAFMVLGLRAGGLERDHDLGKRALRAEC